MTWSTDAVAGALIGGFSLLFLTGALGYRSVRSARQLRIAMATPNIAIAFRPSDSSSSSLDLVVENLGPTAASRVRLAVEPPLISMLDRFGAEIADWFVLQEGLTTLLAGQRYAIGLSQMPDAILIRHQNSKSHRVFVEFDWEADRTRHVAYRLDLDLSMLAHRHQEGEPDHQENALSAKDIARSLKRIEKQLKALSSSKAIRSLAQSILRQLEPRLRAMEKAIRTAAKSKDRVVSDGDTTKQPSRRSRQTKKQGDKAPRRVPLKMHTIDWDATDLPH